MSKKVCKYCLGAGRFERREEDGEGRVLSSTWETCTGCAGKKIAPKWGDNIYITTCPRCKGATTLCTRYTCVDCSLCKGLGVVYAD